MANEYMKAGAVVTLVPESDGKLKFEKADVKDFEVLMDRVLNKNVRDTLGSKPRSISDMHKNPEGNEMTK